MQTTIPSPIGELTLTVDEDGAITALDLPGRAMPAAPSDDPRFERARTQLAEYFAGARTAFELPLRPRGSDFEQRVWDELLRIPCGETITYGEIAQRLGHPKAARAVGRANALNPIAILVPCHRVIGSDGSLTGYAGGLEAKRALLELEAAAAATRASPADVLR
jgi:methylated-DNA-[protein]-cysteine S-methyltransferase